MKYLDSRLVAIGFKAPADLVAQIDDAARVEGVSRSDIARRAVMRDLARTNAHSRKDDAA